MRFTIPSAVLIIVAIRTISLWNGAIPPAEIPAFAARTAESYQLDAAITRIQYQRFDPQAVVVVSPGPDQLPGVAGTDDNMNGVVDDRLELGATRSDDICSVLSAEQLSRIPPDNFMLLQTGAFVTQQSDDSSSKSPQRAFLFGESDGGQPWSVLVEPIKR